MSGGGGKGKKPKQAQIVPVNVSTGFGSANVDPRTGNYSYNLDPRLAAMRDVFYGASQDFLPTEDQMAFAGQVGGQGQQLFGRGQEFLQQALAVNPQETSQKYYSDVQRLMADDRTQEESRLADTLFKTGRSGAAVGTGGGYVNPQQFALLRSRDLANQQLAIESEALGRQRQLGDVQFATGLQSGGLTNYQQGQDLRLQPYSQASGLFGLGTGIEALGFKPLEVGLQGIQAQIAQQQAQQQYNNQAASGGKGGGLLGGVANAAINYGVGTALSGGNPFAGVSSLWSGSSPSSGLGSLFGSSGGWGNLTGTSWSPINTNIGMGGYTAPANFGGGVLGPRF